MRPLSKAIAVLVVAATSGGFGCQTSESKYDIYLAAAQKEGEARRDTCRLMYDEGASNHVISGDQIQTCVKRLEEALAGFERAKAMDPNDLQFAQSVERVQHDIERLEGMLKMVRRMERDKTSP